MAVHQHESMDGDSVLAASFAQQMPIVVAVLFVDEVGTAVYSALGHLHRDFRYLQVSQAWHVRCS